MGTGLSHRWAPSGFPRQCPGRVHHRLVQDRGDSSTRPVASPRSGRVRPPGVGGEVVLECLGKSGHVPRLGAFSGGICARGDLAEEFPGHAAGLVWSDAAETSEGDALVGSGATAGAGAVVDDEGLGAGGLDPDAETCEAVVPGDPGSEVGLEGLDGALGQCGFELGGAFRVLVSMRALYRSSPEVQPHIQHRVRNRRLDKGTHGLPAGLEARITC